MLKLLFFLKNKKELIRYAFISHRKSQSLDLTLRRQVHSDYCRHWVLSFLVMIPFLTLIMQSSNNMTKKKTDKKSCKN